MTRQHLPPGWATATMEDLFATSRMTAVPCTRAGARSVRMVQRVPTNGVF